MTVGKLKKEGSKQLLLDLVKKLKGYDWAFFSGFAVEMYTDGKRKSGNDLDILVSKRDIDKLANSFGTSAKHRRFKKADFYVDDYAFETVFKGTKLEVTSGFPKKRMREGSIDKVFENKTSKDYQGVNVFVEPIEELIVHKAVMHRPKDIRDLKLLLSNQYRPSFLKELASDWGQKKEIYKVLTDVGYKI